MSNALGSHMLVCSLLPSEPAEWVQLLRAGELVVNGRQFTFDDQFGRETVATFEAGVIAPQLPIERDHVRVGQGAAAWMRQLRWDEGAGLYAQVQWTPSGERDVREGNYRYLSVELWTEYTDNAGRVHRNVLDGATLTNHPAVKGMSPVTSFGNENFAVFAELEATSMGKEAQRNESLTPRPPLLRPLAVSGGEEESEGAGGQAEGLAEAPRQAEGLTAEALSALQRQNAELRSRVEGLQLAAERAEFEGALAAVTVHGGKYSPAARAGWTEIALQLAAGAPVDANGAVLLDDKGQPQASWRQRLLTLLSTETLVPQGVLGFAGGESPQGVAQGEEMDADSAAFDGEVRRLMAAEEGLGYGEAAERVAREKPELYKRMMAL